MEKIDTGSGCLICVGCGTGSPRRDKLLDLHTYIAYTI